MSVKGGYIILLLFTFSLSIDAQNLLDRKIDFTIDNVGTAEALKLLSEATTIPFSFSSSFFKSDKKISLQFNQQTIKKILEGLLVNYPLAFKIQNNRVLIFKSKPETFTISGYLEDASNGEKLIAATVYSSTHELGTISNEYGFFSLTLPPGNTSIEVNYIGYATVAKDYFLDKNIHTKIDLKTGYDLPEIVVQPKNNNGINSTNQSTNILNPEKSETIPSLGGEADLMQSAQLLPGIQAPIDGLGGLIVRGGNSGQNLLLLDGVPVYIPYHILGLYSIYNNRTVNSAQVLKGSFPARYGGRLSSVFDVRTREGNNHNYSGEAGINLTTAKALIEGPLIKEKGSFLIAGRKSIADFLLEPALNSLYFQTEEGSLETKFYDLNIKCNYTFSPKDRLFLSLFSGGDEFAKETSEDFDDELVEETEFELYWKNTIGSLRWNHLFSDKLFLNSTLTYSWFDYEQSSFQVLISNDTQIEEDLNFLDSRSENRDLGLKLDFNWIPTANHNIRFGGSFSNKEFLPQITFFDEEDQELDDLEEIDINSLQSLVSIDAHPVTDLVVYVEDQINFSKKLKANIGLRNTAFLTEDRNFFSLEPRLFFNYSPIEKISFKLSTGMMKQYLHLISNTAFSLPNDLWTPSGEDILPQSSWQSEIGIAYRPNKIIQIELEGYYKTLENLYAYPDDPEYLNLLSEDDIEKYLTQGRGNAFGIESYIQYEGKKSGAKISLSYSRITRQYEDQNLGKIYPFEYDYPIQTNIFVYKKLGKYLQASLNWIYQSANPKFPFEVQSIGGADIPMINPLGQKNTSRGRDFHRLDCQLTYSQTFNRFTHKFSIGANNIYNRENAAYFLVEDNTTEPVFSLPIIPALSYSMRLGNFTKF